jgi:hypothetical protein
MKSGCCKGACPGVEIPVTPVEPDVPVRRIGDGSDISTAEATGLDVYAEEDLAPVLPQAPGVVA